ncbi:hypothetical protein [Pantoea sp.]|uniref:hypothetical protein n=1 Tax=Pantoea sp. TaxID=69393 RepID=UPI0028AC8AC3|nr:hypothetical protein [Pantoea sp.]
MTPLFSPAPPWAARALLLSGLLCLPLAGAIVRETLRQQHLQSQITQAEQQLADHQHLQRQLQATQQRRQRQSHQLTATPPAIRMMDNIGQALSPEIALLSLSLDPEKRDAHLTVKATSLNALMAFSQRLQQLPAHVALQNHRYLENNENGWAIGATLDVSFSEEVQHASER